MDLFNYLARRNGEMATCDKLIEALWQDYPLLRQQGLDPEH